MAGSAGAGNAAEGRPSAGFARLAHRARAGGYPFPACIDPTTDFMRPEEVAETVVERARKPERYVVPGVVMVPLIRG